MTRSVVLSTAAALIVVLTGAALIVTQTYQIQPEPSAMQISGTSTIHDWTCDVATVNGRVQADATADTATTLPLDAVTSVQIEIPVESIDCDKDRMNKNLREAMRADAYPTILFSLDDASLGPLPDSSDTWFQVDATGELIISGTRRQVELDVKGQRLDGDRLRFVGETPLKMSDFEVERPSFMLGTVKTGDDVTVAFDVVAARDAG